MHWLLPSTLVPTGLRPSACLYTQAPVPSRGCGQSLSPGPFTWAQLLLTQDNNINVILGFRKTACIPKAEQGMRAEWGKGSADVETNQYI